MQAVRARKLVRRAGMGCDEMAKKSDSRGSHTNLKTQDCHTGSWMRTTDRGPLTPPSLPKSGREGSDYPDGLEPQSKWVLGRRRSEFRGHLEALAVLARQHLIGLLVVDERLALRIDRQLQTEMILG